MATRQLWIWVPPPRPLPVALLTLRAPLPTCVEGLALPVKSTGSGWPTHASAGQRHGCGVQGCAACKPVCPSPTAESVAMSGLCPVTSIFHTPSRMSFLRSESGVKYLTRSRHLPAKGNSSAGRESLTSSHGLPAPRPPCRTQCRPFPSPHPNPLPVVLPTWDAHPLTTGNHLEDPGCAKVSHASPVPHHPPPCR